MRTKKERRYNKKIGLHDTKRIKSKTNHVVSDDIDYMEEWDDSDIADIRAHFLDRIE